MLWRIYWFLLSVFCKYFIALLENIIWGELGQIRYPYLSVMNFDEHGTVQTLFIEFPSGKNENTKNYWPQKVRSCFILIFDRRLFKLFNIFDILDCS